MDDVDQAREAAIWQARIAALRAAHEDVGNGWQASSQEAVIERAKGYERYFLGLPAQ
jgi:hypothetical protein